MENGRLGGLQCRECGRTYPIEPIHVCDFCFGPLDVTYDYPALRQTLSREAIERGPLSLWRYWPLLPVERPSEDDGYRVGFTPLQRARNLGKALGLRNLWIKNDSVNPSYSFKDRVVAVAIKKAREFGFTTFACASTGNLAGAVAAAAAREGMAAYVFLPGDTEESKLVHARSYGAQLIAVNGSYDDVNRLCSELADTYPWAFCNINMRPYYSEGSKSLAFEVTEQLGWTLPDHVVAPVASGSLVTKLHKGFGELQKVGLVAEGSVRISAAQAEGCAPVSEAFLAGREAVRPVREPKTIAKSLAIGNPADGYYVIRIVKDTGGSMTISSDEDIAAAMKLLAETEGIFTETAGGVTISSLKQLVASGVVQPDECVVAYITGNGLKTLEAVAPVARQPVHVDATIGSFESTLGLTPPSTPVGAAPALVE